jgi:hypothetical protein
MKVSQPRISMGALALVAGLALPAGLLSLFSRTTTGEQVDMADLVFVGRVASLQVVDAPLTTYVEFDVDHAVLGRVNTRSLNLSVEGRVQFSVGDDVLALVGRRPVTLLGAYQVRKDPRTLDHGVVSPVTGMLAQGIDGGGPQDPISLGLLEAAIRLRRGEPVRAVAAASDPPSGQLAQDGGGDGGVPPDAFEPNDSAAAATFLTGLHLPTLVTGNPLLLTDLTITSGDVDYFSFNGAALWVVFAETLPPVTGLPEPDTFMGLFGPPLPPGDLLAFDDDGGEGKFSQITHSLEGPGTYAVAVESAPDPGLLFDGSTGTTEGHYTLSVELKLGSYVWNQWDTIVGISPDGTFIEDLVGYKLVGGLEVLASPVAGTQADAWALDFDVQLVPSGVTHVYGGAGDQLTDPMFLNAVEPLSFELGPLIDASGLNRQGLAEASSMVLFTAPGASMRGVVATHHYEMSLFGRTVRGDLALQMGTDKSITDLNYTRVFDVDLFGPGPDEFFWGFNPNDKLKAFAVDTSTNVGNVVVPAQPISAVSGQDMQMCLLIEHGDSNGTGFADITHYKTGFTLVRGFGSQADAANEAVRRLRYEAGATTWVVATDQDPMTNLWAAFGAGLGP